MGNDKNENIVEIWFNNLSKIRSTEIQNLIKTTGCPDLKLPLWNNLDDAVVNTVISQMLSSKAADSIINRIYSHFKSSSNLLNYIIRSKLDKPLFGISIRKQKSLFYWANCPIRNKYNKMKISKYEIEDLFTDVWGLGKWSIDMISIFYFCIPDVWPTSDSVIMKYTNTYFNGKKPASINGLETITALCIWHGMNTNKF